jgi:AcrR family transcriptional regulator
MAGVKRFDVDAVLDRIVEAFWRNGFEGTSVEDLEAATGLRRGSLYNAFGDKAEMLRLALDRYGATRAARISAALAGDDPRRALADYFAAQARAAEDDRVPPGCMALSISGELGARGDDLGRTACAAPAGQRAALEEAFARWKAAGRLSADADPRALASFVAAVVQGIAASHRVGAPRADLDAAADVALAGLERWLPAI